MTPDLITQDFSNAPAQASLAPPAGSVLPCPFCGGEPKIFTRKVHDDPASDRRLFWYVCNTYGCGVGVTHGEWSERQAREKWNKRTPAPNSSNA